MMIRVAIVLCLCLGPLAADAATCIWTAPSGAWSLPANWSGCADAPGPSTRAPGPGDIAVVASGQADLDTDATVAEFEIATNGIVSSIGSGALRTLTVATALRLNGGKITTQLGQNQLLLVLPAGATGALLASTTFENATFLENSGTLALGSANGMALSLLVAAQLRNMPGGMMSFAGGDSHLVMNSSSELINNAGAIFSITGNTLVNRPPAAFTVARIRNFGAMTVNGPGTLTLALGGSGAHFQQSGQLTASNATIVCNQLSGEMCSFIQNGNGASSGIVTRLASASLDLGGATSDLIVANGTTLTGTGTINARGVINGLVAPGALSGAPYGDLAFSGSLQVNSPAALDFDLAGSAAGSYDRLVLGGKMTVGGVFSPAGYGVLNLRLAAGYQPALGAAVPIASYTSVESGSAFRRVDANHTLDYAARFDSTALQVFPAPRITIENVSVIEGNSGDIPAVFNVRLSQPSTQTVTAAVEWSEGTASSGSTPTGDFAYPGTLSAAFAPGQTLQTLPIQVHGDTVAEGDEAFTLALVRNTVVNAAIGTGVPGNVVASGTIVSDDLPADTRFILIGKDDGAGSGNRIRRYTTSGTFIDSWGPNTPNIQGHIGSGMCFSAQGNVLGTRFGAPSPVYYSPAGAILNGSFGVIPGDTALQEDESCVFDLAGNVYIGQATPGGVKKFDRYGVPLDSFDVPIGPRGSDWIELGGDQCTLYYTSEGTIVHRYDVCTRNALPDFAVDLTPPYCYALRRRPNGELMVACQEAVHRLSPLGASVQTYTRQSIGETEAHGLFALNLDPDGTSFWTAGAFSGNVYRVDIESGAVLASFNSGAGGVGGLAVYGQLGDDTIFVDGFDPPGVAVPVVPTGPSTPLYRESRCKEKFWPEIPDMPHYVPEWVSRVVIDDGHCRAPEQTPE